MNNELLIQIESQLLDLGITEDYIQTTMQEYGLSKEDAMASVIQSW